MKKRIILHDLTEAQARAILPVNSEETTVFSALPIVKGCIGCFGCWTKTPGVCGIKDRATDFPLLMATHEELIVVSRMTFGGVSPEIKAVLDRSIGFILPYFRMVGGEMHHVQRYDHRPNLRYLYYGEHITPQEEATAHKLVAANGLNFASRNCVAAFYASPEAIDGGVFA